MFAVNWRGQFATIRTFAPLLKASGDGLIVSISSIAGRQRRGSSIAYGAAKAGIDVMTKSLARALAPRGARDGRCARRRRHRLRAGPRRGFNAKAAATTPLKRVGHRRRHRRGHPRLRHPSRLFDRHDARGRRRPRSVRRLEHRCDHAARQGLITCAVTGNLTTPEQTPHLPITPEQIADVCLGAAEAGAPSCICMCAIRAPASRRWSLTSIAMLSSASAPRTRELILNITTGPGGRFVPSEDDPKIAGPGTTLMAPEKRVEHIAVLKPEICTLDLNTMNSGDEVVINTPKNVRRMAKVINDAGVRPEIELFDSGDIAMMHDLSRTARLPRPAAVLLRDGRALRLPALARNRALRAQSAARRRDLHRHRHRPSRLHQRRAVLSRRRPRARRHRGRRLSIEGVLAESNAVLVEKARRIVEDLGGQIANARETRDMLGFN